MLFLPTFRGPDVCPLLSTVVVPNVPQESLVCALHRAGLSRDVTQLRGLCPTGWQAGHSVGPVVGFWGISLTQNPSTQSQQFWAENRSSTRALLTP